MPNLVKATLMFDDGSTQEFAASVAPEVISITDVKVEKSDGSVETFNPA